MRPRRLVAVVGTGTDVGKTWVAARLLTDLGAAGLRVAARKPAQSFEPEDDPARLDAAVLGAATGEPPEEVCPPHRWYEVPMAPPMAAERLHRPSFTIQDLVSELRWPPGAGADPATAADAAADANPDAAPNRADPADPDAAPNSDAVEVGLVETAGGLRSPLAADGDCLAFCEALAPDVIVLVADAGLGTINAVRLTLDALRPPGAPHVAPHVAPQLDPQLVPQLVPVVVVLNRYDAAIDLHVRNHRWLQARDGLTVVTLPGGEPDLVALVCG